MNNAIALDIAMLHDYEQTEEYEGYILTTWYDSSEQWCFSVEVSEDELPISEGNGYSSRSGALAAAKVETAGKP